MPITTNIFPFVDLSIKTYLNNSKRDIEGLKMCELGDQLLEVEGIDFKVAKDYFESLGVNHTSLDINGQHEALQVDLSVPIKDKKLLNSFDVITNLGTSEHVENQYECFRNIHNLCKRNGLFIHAVPSVGSWLGHCKYYYTPMFFMQLVNNCNYTIINWEVITVRGEKTNDVCVAMIKNKNNKFVNKEIFDKFEN